MLPLLGPTSIFPSRSRFRLRSLFLCLMLTLSLGLSVLTSCTKQNFQVSNLQAQPYIRADGTMALSLYLMTNADSPTSIQMTVTDPSGNLSWTFPASQATISNDKYYGTSDITMPTGVPLPQGTWTLLVYYKDGSKEELTFPISYGDPSAALVSVPSTTDPFFDPQSNLTIITY